MGNFTKIDFINQLMECYRKKKYMNHFNGFLIFTEISPADSERYNLFIWKKNGNYTPILHFYDLKINDNDEIERIFEKIKKEINPEESLDDIIKKFDNKKITFKEYNSKIKENEER